MKVSATVAALVCIAVLTACAQDRSRSTESDPFNAAQACASYACAVGAEQLSDGTYRIWGRGVLGEHEQAEEYARLKAAETTLEQGMTHFRERSADVVLYAGYLDVELVIDMTADPDTADAAWQSAQDTYDRLAPLYIETP